MDDYVDKKIHIFQHKLKITDMAIMPAGNNIFDNGNGEPLSKSQPEDFHLMFVKSLFLSKRARPDVHPTILYWLLG